MIELTKPTADFPHSGHLISKIFARLMKNTIRCFLAREPSETGYIGCHPDAFPSGSKVILMSTESLECCAIEDCMAHFLHSGYGPSFRKIDGAESMSKGSPTKHTE